MITQLKYLLRVLITPSCWVRSEWFTDRAWDKELLKMLENPKFLEVDRYTVYLNEKPIWVANYPYGCCSQRSSRNSPKDITGLPSRTTVFKFFDALKKYKLGLEK